MFLSQALDRIYSFTPESFGSLADILSPELLQRPGPNDAKIELTSSPQALRKWPSLTATLKAQLVTKTIKGKSVQILTSMVDKKRFSRK